jgi:hypothetical protein
MYLMQEFSVTSGNSEGSSLKIILGYLEEDIVECGEFNIVQENAFEFYLALELKYGISLVSDLFYVERDTIQLGSNRYSI